MAADERRRKEKRRWRRCESGRGVNGGLKAGGEIRSGRRRRKEGGGRSGSGGGECERQQSAEWRSV